MKKIINYDQEIVGEKRDNHESMRKGYMKSKLEAILKQHLQYLVKTKHIKHAILAIESMGGSFKWLGAKGIAHPDGTTITPETPFCIASVTKLYIATTI